MIADKPCLDTRRGAVAATLLSLLVVGTLAAIAGCSSESPGSFSPDDLPDASTRADANDNAQTSSPAPDVGKTTGAGRDAQTASSDSSSAADAGGSVAADSGPAGMDTLAAADAPSPAPDAPVEPAGNSDFPGHQPGKIYLGYAVDDASCAAGSTVAAEEAYTGPTRLGRFYQSKINATSAEVSQYHASLAAGRIAWISFKEEPYTWAQIAAGAADAELTAKAVAYQGVSGPGFVTFHHEPINDGPAADYVAAWNRILDVFAAAGGTGKITPLPILDGYFQGYPNNGNGYTDAEMADWLPDALIARFRVIGFDGYDSGAYGSVGVPLARVVRKWREWLLRRQAVINDGKKRYLALGETGVFYGSTNAGITSWKTSDDGEFPDGYPGWDTVWQTLVANATGDASFVALNYYNSIVNTRANCDWSLRARRPTVTQADLACDSGNEQPPPGASVADATRVTGFSASLQSAAVADVRNWTP